MDPWEYPAVSGRAPPTELAMPTPRNAAVASVDESSIAEAIARLEHANIIQISVASLQATERKSVAPPGPAP